LPSGPPEDFHQSSKFEIIDSDNSIYSSEKISNLTRRKESIERSRTSIIIVPLVALPFFAPSFTATGRTATALPQHQEHQTT
jgi:hypothetical protein